MLPRRKRKIAVATITAFILVFAVSSFSAIADDAVVTDPNLKAALITLGADIDLSGQISQAEVAALTGDLVLSSQNIEDIAGLEYATGVSFINLQGNKIRDISKLLTLVGTTPPTTTPPALTKLDISHNYLDFSEGVDGSDKTAKDTLVAALSEYVEATGRGVIYEPQDIPAAGIALDKESTLLGIDESANLTAVVSPDNATNKDVIWFSTDEAIATVADGTVTGVSAGSANITATCASNSALTATCAVTVKFFSIESTKYPIDRTSGIIKGIPKMTSPNDFLSNLRNETTDLTIFDAAGNLSAETILKTGMTLKLNVGGTERDALRIAVSGDGNGDGMISVSDYTLTRLDILGLKTLDDISRAACDVNGDGKISISDYTTLRLDILGVKAISALPDLPEVSDPRIKAFIDAALMQQGEPYVWSAEGPDSFDCSGYIWYCLKQVGYNVERKTASYYSQKADWPYVPKDQLQPGDLMFYISDSNPSVIGHIGIYLGNGYHIHASSDYGCVIICRIDGWYERMLSHGRRVFN